MSRYRRCLRATRNSSASHSIGYPSLTALQPGLSPSCTSLALIAQTERRAISALLHQEDAFLVHERLNCWCCPFSIMAVENPTAANTATTNDAPTAIFVPTAFSY